MALCEGSVIYISPIDSQPFWACLYVQIIAHPQVQIYLPSQSSSVNFQSFCQTESFVKEVLARSTQMS